MRKALIVVEHPGSRRFARRLQAEGPATVRCAHKDDSSGAALAAVLG